MNEWLEENHLSLHLGKTQYIIFWVKQTRLQKYKNLHIACNGPDIEIKEDVEYLGVV